MTPLAAAFHNISMMRRKIEDAQDSITSLDAGPQRDAAIAQLTALISDLVRGVQDFAALGFENDVADLIEQAEPVHSLMQSGRKH